MLNWLGTLFWLLPLRLRSTWPLLAIVSFGVLAATTLVSVSYLYSRALAESGLKHAVAVAPRDALNAQLEVTNRPLGPGDYQTLDKTVMDLVQDRLGFMLRDFNRRGQTQANIPLAYTTEPSSSDLNLMLGRPFFLTGLEEHSTLLEGSWPSPTPQLDESGVTLETVVGDRTARSMVLNVGDQVYLFPFRTDTSQRITLNITGIARATDPREEYWLGNPSYFYLGQRDERPLLPFYVREEAFFQGIGTRFGSLVGDYGWLLYLDTSVLEANLVQPARDAFRGLEVDINKRVPRSSLFTLLENSRGTGLLATYQRDLMLARVPIFLFIALVFLVVLYFIALIISLMAQSRGEEASIFRSRGASMPQVGGLLSLTEGLMGLGAILLGPLLALFLARFWLLDTVRPMGDWNAASTGLSWEIFLWSALGGVLSFAILLVAGANLSRSEILEFLRSRARPPRLPILQRYYLDLLALALLGLLVWQIQQRGGFLDRSLEGRTLEVDPTLLVVPAGVLLAAGLLVFRILPLLLQLVAGSGSRLAPAWAGFSLSRISRDPISHSSLTVLVMMAAALGLFGAAFQATLSRNEQEQALFDVGGDLVATQMAFPDAVAEERRRELMDVPGISSVSPILRDTGNPLAGFAVGRTQILAIDPFTLPEAGWFREDFATTPKSLDDLLLPLRLGDSGLADFQRNITTGVPLPEESDYIGVWVNVKNLAPDLSGGSLKLALRLAGAQGRYEDLILGDFDPQNVSTADQAGWRFMQAHIPSEELLVRWPISVVSLHLTGPGFSRMAPGSLYLDDITVGSTSAGSESVIEDFERTGRWQALANDQETSDSLEYGSEGAHTGDLGLAFSWVHPVGNLPRGAFIPPGPFPIPAIGNEQFYAGQELRIKVGPQVVPVAIKDTVRLFPTMKPPDDPFLVVPVKAYRQYLQRLTRNSVDRPDEFWISVGPTADRSTAIDNLRQAIPSGARVEDSHRAVDIARRNPLAGGGWNGLTLLSIATLTIAVLIALATHAVVSIREGRVDLTVARTLGFSKVQIFLALATERALITLAGGILGGGVGYFLARWVLGFLDSNPRGQPVVPPAIFETQGWIIVFALACLFLASAAAILLASVAAERLKPSDILRNGE